MPNHDRTCAHRQIRTPSGDGDRDRHLRSVTCIADLYLRWLASAVLATVREAFAVAPGVTDAQVLVIRCNPTELAVESPARGHPRRTGLTMDGVLRLVCVGQTVNDTAIQCDPGEPGADGRSADQAGGNRDGARAGECDRDVDGVGDHGSPGHTKPHRRRCRGCRLGGRVAAAERSHGDAVGGPYQPATVGESVNGAMPALRWVTRR
jgi:hypothetical protein